MESLNQIVERLQQLHLEQRRILHALEIIVVAADQDPTNVNPTPTTTVGGPVATVAAVAVPITAVTPTPTVFHIGQQVYITNRITHVLTRRASEADRTAIVTHFTASRVAIRTINGFHTHRHPKNLRPLN